MSNLTEVQKAYVWLAGSFPNRVVRQGRGVRGRPVYYAFEGEEVLFLFGYSNPLYWLENRGLFKKLQDGYLMGSVIQAMQSSGGSCCPASV